MLGLGLGRVVSCLNTSRDWRAAEEVKGRECKGWICFLTHPSVCCRCANYGGADGAGFVRQKQEPRGLPDSRLGGGVCVGVRCVW